MNICAIIAEYNPLHEGHLYHIRETRRQLGSDTALIAVLSGHAVQRGDFPILTKAARTEMALRAGHDLVFELPAPHACAPAERFARGALSIIGQLGMVTHLSFGTECVHLSELEEQAQLQPAQYPKEESLAAALPRLYPRQAHLFTANNILAMEYLKAIEHLKTLPSPPPAITPVLIPRKGSRHDDDGTSASGWRKRLIAGDSCKELPFTDIIQREMMVGRAPILLEQNEKAVLSHLRRLSSAQLAALPDVSGGLDRRLYHAIRQAGSLSELYTFAKTKRYILARIRRCVMAAFLGLTERDASAVPHLRLLGIGKGGARLLSMVGAPLLSRPAAHKEALALEAAITDQLALCMPCPQPAGLEWRQGVVKVYA